MIDSIIETAVYLGIGELLFLITGIYATYRFFVFKEIASLILGVFFIILFIVGIIHWINKGESLFTRHI
jgi:hypothetical protein